jgi:hypothetical protein
MPVGSGFRLTAHGLSLRITCSISQVRLIGFEIAKLPLCDGSY